jgi:hypothetical protein
MDKKTVFVKTTKGENEFKGKGGGLSGDLKRALLLIDDLSTVEEVAKRSPPSLRAVLVEMLRQLLAGGFIRDKAKPFAEAQITAPRIVTPEADGELDFTSIASTQAPRPVSPDATNEAVAKAKKEADAARARAEVEAAMAAAKVKARAEAHAKAEANAKQAAEIEARNRTETEARAKQEALIRAQTAAKAKIEAEARLRAEQVAAEIKLQQEAAAKAKAEVEARIKQEIEAARIKAEQEAARLKAEREAAQLKAEAEARARQEAEAARIKAEQKAAQIKAEAEARAFAEARARQEAEAARVKAEQEVARLRAEAEARELAEARARQEAEAARIKAEQEAAVKAAAEAEARALDEAQEAAPIDAEASNSAQAQQDKRFEVEPALFEREQAYAKQELDAESQKLADEQARAWAAAEQRAQGLARAEAERAAQTAEAAPASKSAIPQAARARRKPLPIGKILAALPILLLLSIWLVPYVMPLNDYIAPVEKQLSAQFKQPVHVGALHGELLPWPKLHLEKVTLGAGQEVSAGSITLAFDPFTLFAPVKNVRSLELQDVVLDSATLEKEAVWLQEVGATAGYQIAQVTVQHMKVSTPEITLPLFNGTVNINAQGRVSKAAFKSDDGKFDLSLQPAPGHWQVTLNAKGTALPMLPNVLFEDFTANGEISSSGANFADIDAQAYGGFVRGNAKLTWQKGWQLQGHIGAKSVDLVKLFPKVAVTGELQTNSNFSAAASKLSQLADDVQIDGSFVVTKVVVNNMDIVETVRLRNSQVGRTHFDELTGNYQSNGRGQHFQQLQMTSGILSGNGSFDVNKAQVSGHLSVELKSRPGATALSLSGTVVEPTLRTGR